MYRCCWQRGLSLLGLVGAAGACRATVVFDNFNYHNAYDRLFDYSSGTTINKNQQAAFQFTAADSGKLSQITLAVSNFTQRGDPPPTGAWVDVVLYSDNGNSVGVELGNWHVDIPADNKFPTVFDPETVDTSSPAVSIGKGSKYWLAVLQGQTPASGWTWNWNYLGAPGNTANDEGFMSISHDNGANYRTPESGVRGAFKVETSAVPEPCTVLAAVGGLLLAVKRRRR